MKPLLFVFCCMLFTGTSFALPLKRIMPDPDLPKSIEQTFEFIFKLDSLNYRSGKVHLKCKLVNRLNQSKLEKVNSRYEQLSDSLYSIRVKGKTYLLNTKSGRVINSKNGRIIYRSPRFRFYEYEKTTVRGTDEFGPFTAYFAGFYNNKSIPSDIVYDPKFITPNKSVQYSLACTPMTNDTDSTWLENDTTKVFKEYGNDKRIISERRERISASGLPEIIEFHYSWLGDTLVTNLAYFDNGFHDKQTEELYVTKNPFKLKKQLTLTGDHKVYSYEYTEGDNGNSLQINNKSWKFNDRGGFYLNQTDRQLVFNGEERFKLSENTRIHFSGKK